MAYVRKRSGRLQNAECRMQLQAPEVSPAMDGWAACMASEGCEGGEEVGTCPGGHQGCGSEETCSPSSSSSSRPAEAVSAGEMPSGTQHEEGP